MTQSWGGVLYKAIEAMTDDGYAHVTGYEFQGSTRGQITVNQKVMHCLALENNSLPISTLDSDEVL